jgi:hypothetical protein
LHRTDIRYECHHFVPLPFLRPPSVKRWISVAYVLERSGEYHFRGRHEATRASRFGSIDKIPPSNDVSPQKAAGFAADSDFQEEGEW